MRDSQLETNPVCNRLFGTKNSGERQINKINKIIRYSIFVLQLLTTIIIIYFLPFIHKLSISRYRNSVVGSKEKSFGSCNYTYFLVLLFLLS